MQTMSAGTTVAGSPEMTQQAPVFQTQAGMHRYYYEQMYPPHGQGEVDPNFANHEMEGTSGTQQRHHHEMEGSGHISELPAGEQKRT